MLRTSTSVPNVDKGVVQKFALNSCRSSRRTVINRSTPASFVLPPPTPEQVIQAAPYKNAPTDAVVFFNQLGTAVATNPIPNRGTGLSGTALNDLPAWVVPQYGAKTIYRVPSYGQKAILDSFAPLGLTKNGFRIPADWEYPSCRPCKTVMNRGSRFSTISSPTPPRTRAPTTGGS